MAKPTDKSRDRVPVDFDVFGSGTKGNRKIKFLFNEIGGRHQFIIDNVDKNNTTETVERKVKLGVDYKVTAALVTGDPKPVDKKAEYNIELAALGSNGRGNNSRIGDIESRKITYFDGDGDDANATFTIESTSPGIEAKFSNDGNKLIVNGGSGDISLKLKWDDNPKQYGLAVGELKVGGQTFKQSGEKVIKPSL